MTTQSNEREYLAYAPIMGGGSWARGKDLEKQVKRCARFVSDDWGSVFDIRGKHINIGVFDVTDYDELGMANGDVWVNVDGQPLSEREWLAPLEIRKVIVPKR